VPPNPAGGDADPTSFDASQANPRDARLYPVGDRMAVGLYSADPPEDIPALVADGFNLFHSYGDPTPVVDAAAAADGNALGSLPGEAGSLDEADRAAFAALASAPSVAWWDLPEERRWWVPEEMQILDEYELLIRAEDEARRPTYMYIPSHYDALDVSKYVPLIDIVPASVYTTNSGQQPHAWARWRMETTLDGIALAGATVGPDFAAGERTPVAVLELFGQSGEPLSAEGAYHDFWQVLVSGARGILIFSYFHRNDDASCLMAWDGLKRATRELVGPQHLDQVLLEGAPVDGIRASVTSGPSSTPTFQPLPGSDLEVSYPSIDLTARQWGGALYLFAVSSAEQAVTTSLTGLPPALVSGEVLFHDETVVVADGSVSLELEPLGVRILRLR